MAVASSVARLLLELDIVLTMGEEELEIGLGLVGRLNEDEVEFGGIEMETDEWRLEADERTPLEDGFDAE